MRTVKNDLLQSLHNFHTILYKWVKHHSAILETKTVIKMIDITFNLFIIVQNKSYFK